MGSIRKLRKKYSRPLHPWRKERIEYEKKILEQYGLKNKKEIWKSDSRLRRIFHQVKRLIAAQSEQAEKEKRDLINKLMKYNLLKENSTLDDVLSLKLEDLLDRRLQTFVFKKNLANSAKQARQFIAHGHIYVNEQKVNIPSYMVKKDEEDKILYSSKSSLHNPEHPEVVKIKSRLKEINLREEKIKEEKKEHKIEKIEKKQIREEKSVKGKIKKVTSGDKKEKKEKKEVKKKEDKK